MREIYQKQDHPRRVQLLKHHLMEVHDQWKNRRTLFKYGANHLTRGESFLTVMDIGNIVANLSEANYDETLQLIILGESGMQASAFETFPATPIKTDGFYQKHLKPFMDLTEGEDWAVFDLIPLRKHLIRGKLKIDNQNLRRTIMGYDLLKLIPRVTAAEF